MASFCQSYLEISFASRDLILSAFRPLKTPFLAALSTIEKAFAIVSRVGVALKASRAFLVFVFVALLYKDFFLSDLTFFSADLVIGMGVILQSSCVWRKSRL